MSKIKLYITKAILIFICLFTLTSASLAIETPKTNTISKLNIENVELSPDFSPYINDYTAKTEQASIVINVVVKDSKSSVEGAGKIDLNYGKNNLEIKLKHKNIDDNIYKLTIDRVDNRSSNNNLEMITVSNGTLAFKPDNTIYSLTFDQSVENVSLEAKLEDEKAIFIENYGSPREVSNLAYGNNPVFFKVMAENEKIKTYTVNIHRNDGRSSNNYLSSLTTNHGSLAFINDKQEYSIKIPNSVTSIDVSATPENKNSQVAAIGGNNLVVGSNIITISVTSENGEAREYTITVNRLSEKESLPSNSRLLSLKIGKKTVPLVNKKFKYLVVVKNDNPMDVRPVPEDPEAIVSIRGTSEPLRVGSAAKIIVTAQDGSSSEYSIKVKKQIGIYVLVINLVVMVVSFILIVIILTKHIKEREVRSNTKIAQKSDSAESNLSR